MALDTIKRSRMPILAAHAPGAAVGTANLRLSSLSSHTADQQAEFRDSVYRNFLPGSKTPGKTTRVVRHDDRHGHLADAAMKSERGRIVSITRNAPAIAAVERHIALDA